MDSDDDSDIILDISLPSDSDDDDENYGFIRYSNWPDGMLNGTEHSSGSDTDRSSEYAGIIWLSNAKCLQSLCCLQLVKDCDVRLLQSNLLPKPFYTILLSEAFRVHSVKYIPALVARWPHAVLDLNADVLCPWDWQGRFTRYAVHRISLADLVIQGLLHQESSSKLHRVILPNMKMSAKEDAAILRKFLHLPKLALDLDKIERVEVNDGASPSSQEKPKIRICGVAVVEWLGKKCNYEEILEGLSLSTHTQFEFEFSEVILKNAMDLKTVYHILEAVHHKESVKRILFNNYGEAIHIIFKMTALAPVLNGFINVESFLSQFDGLYMTTLINQPNVSMAIQESASLLQQWTHLQELNIGGNLLTGRIEALLGGLHTPLTLLNISATGLNPDDLQFLCDSKHAASIKVFNIDHNDLHGMRAVMVKLCQKMESLVTLRTCCTLINHEDAMLMASALKDCKQLESWSLLQNDVSTLMEMRTLLVRLRQCPSLRWVACKPFELHALFAGLLVHTVGPPPLSAEQDQELLDLAKDLKIDVF